MKDLPRTDAVQQSKEEGREGGCFYKYDLLLGPPTFSTLSPQGEAATVTMAEINHMPEIHRLLMMNNATEADVGAAICAPPLFQVSEQRSKVLLLAARSRRLVSKLG